MRIRLEVADLDHGMFVAELDRPWLESPFLFQGFVIEDDAELLQLRATCRWVMVEDQKSRRNIDFKKVQLSGAERQAKDYVTVARQTAKVAERATAQVEELMHKAELGGAVEPEDAREVVGGLMHAVATNANAALWLTSLKKRDARIASHCLNTSILALAFAQYLGEPFDEMEAIGLGALLHDIGLAKTPRFIVDKKTPLEPAERALMEQHVETGEAMLFATKRVSPKALRIILQHHERIDGSGYPKHLKGAQIDRGALIVGLADVYDALTSEQPWRPAELPQKALTTMRAQLAEQFGLELVESFIRCLGIYPIGSLVRLSTGALAVVLSSDLETRLKPMVMLVKDADGKALVQRQVVSLKAVALSQPNAPWTIVEMLEPTAHGIDVHAVVASELGGR
jgi:putative nucleotidyltransferase with HDIG domain